MWIHEEVLNGWYETSATGGRGASNYYSDLAIVCTAQIRFLYKLPLRATQGFLISLFHLLNVTQTVPSYTTLSRRMTALDFPIPVAAPSSPRDVVLDSTGLNEGEWKVRTHGASYRRTWRKVHLGFDAKTQEIMCATLTTNDFKDSEVFEDCLSQVPSEEIASVRADGAYDSENCYRYCIQHSIQPLFPPRRGAKIKQHGNHKKTSHPRDEALRYIRKNGRKKWKEKVNYHKRSLAETGMYRLKNTFSQKLSSRLFESQSQEIFIKCGVLNQFAKLGLAQSVAA